MDEIDGLFSHLKAWYRSDQDDMVDDFYSRS
jgi:hypothetical protein